MSRFFFGTDCSTFLALSTEEIIGRIAIASPFADEPTQKFAWEREIKILKGILPGYTGKLYFEFNIPRMGKRIDVVLLIKSVIFVLEFKVGESDFNAAAIDQVWDYAIDLKNFHETSHEATIAPILVATQARAQGTLIQTTIHDDNVLYPILTNVSELQSVIENVLYFSKGDEIDQEQWEAGAYQPTPTIVEAAQALYAGHSVEEISRRDASATNLTETSSEIERILFHSQQNNQKSICFVTGVPGAGKTLVGLNIATKNIDKENELYSVFLSGNGPLVAVLREALARNRVMIEAEKGNRIRKSDAKREVSLFIQNVHNFRDECLLDLQKPPLEHVALFDEAQRAWDVQQTANFMVRKKHIPNFNQSEPEFLISCLDRHNDWATIVCLVGGGQEINTGETGIAAWIEAVTKHFPNWHIYFPPQLKDSEYSALQAFDHFEDRDHLHQREALHLGVSMRSFRSEKVSLLVKQVLDLDVTDARETLKSIGNAYPIRITRDIQTAKRWLKEHARGTERYGMLVSSQALRLKPLAIDIRAEIDPIHWFLDGKEDIRSSYYLEDAATEFQVQGLEVDWACVVWDGDFRIGSRDWIYKSFTGDKWNNINKPERKKYLKNACRVLLTRARQGMVIVVPNGDPEDPTRKAEYYDPMFEYLKNIGFQTI
ncbi:MAG: DUF2075 domain-containing protein [Anaerolineaceae bacterium]|nr:DUF2075 domain-containing protein [Anaerolineaceae bacterium]